MNNQRQSDAIGRLPRSFESFRLVLPVFGEVGRAANLDADDYVAMSGDDPLDILDAAITQIVQLAERRQRADTADQPLPGDVQQREDARFGLVDHKPAEAFKDQSARSAEVDDRGHAARQTRWIDFNPEVADARKDMDVEVDQARHNVLAADINGATCLG